MRQMQSRSHAMRVLLVMAAAISAGSAIAHHSNAMFDQKNRLELTGTVREFKWSNPHCYIQLLVKDGSGKEKDWSIEMGAIPYLKIGGWRPSTLKAGDRIRVVVSPLRKGGNAGLFFSATTADGSPLVQEAK